MTTPRTATCYRQGLILVLGTVLFGTVWPGYSHAEPQSPPGSDLSFSETTDAGEATAQILAGAEKDAFLKAHNDARKALGLDPLIWSNNIGKYSLSWIKHNHRAYSDSAIAGNLPALKHRPHEGEFQQKHGENLAAWNGPRDADTNARKAVTLWLAEKTPFDTLNKQKPYVVGDEQDHNDAHGNPVVVGHYTQIVWKSTTHIGAARWTFKSKDQTFVVIVSNYSPPGNFIGKKPY